MISATTAIEQTQRWIKNVVIGANFCPFAAKPFLNNRIHYEVFESVDLEKSLEAFVLELQRLDTSDEVETSFLIFTTAFSDFDDYLDLVDMAETLLEELDYEGIYQVASFHPDYCFEDATEDDPANYTNRSMFPMLHILREDSLSKVLDSFPDAEGVPARNIAYTQEKGLKYMKALWESCK